MAVKNAAMATYVFLESIEEDGYFPPRLVLKGKRILTRLCESIEYAKPQSLDQLYALKHRTTEQFNELALDLEAAGSQLETMARDNICRDIEAIAKAYGFEAGGERLVAPRRW